MIDPLTLDQMRVLVAVAETGSFSAAARRLRRVQSAISLRPIQAMEATLGVPLFDRSTKTPTLTDAGAAIVADARAIVTSAMAPCARGRRASPRDVEAELTLAVDAMFPMPLLMREPEALRGAFPGLPATVFTEELGGAEETLRSGAARMAIYPAARGPDAGHFRRIPDQHHARAGRRGRATRSPGALEPIRRERRWSRMSSSC